jgi:hypothetical protein
LVTITAETRSQIVVAIKSKRVLDLVPERTRTDAIKTIMTVLEHVAAMDRWELSQPRAAYRRDQLNETAEACATARAAVGNLSASARVDLLDSEAAKPDTVDARTRRFFAVLRGPDQATCRLLDDLAAMEQRARETAVRLDQRREGKPRQEARRILIDQLRGVFLSFHTRKPDAMTARAWRQKQAAFIRAIFQHIEVACPEVQDPVAARLRELDALEIDLLSGSLG